MRERKTETYEGREKKVPFMRASSKKTRRWKRIKKTFFCSFARWGKKESVEGESRKEEESR